MLRLTTRRALPIIKPAFFGAGSRRIMSRRLDSTSASRTNTNTSIGLGDLVLFVLPTAVWCTIGFEVGYIKCLSDGMDKDMKQREEQAEERYKTSVLEKLDALKWSNGR
ncbi:uncharacterized protein L201_002441 [Kwoniella dendrophila CBS 6074]|uniref:Uncharacterized protein n=1 Tax=Kwoniella dendrophila CBS 6074 TaxID=1295534 RepID=A0AAX4JQ77_9TREE